MFVLPATFLLVMGATSFCSVAVAQKEEPPKTGAEKPRFEDWKYPKAKELSSGQGAGGSHAVLTTTDDLDKVIAFYEKKTGQTLKVDQPGGQSISGGAGEARLFQDDSIQPGIKSEPRPVVVRILVQRATSYDLTLVISKAKGEDYTHIAMTYFSR